jgi:hypothetical protein
MRPMTKGEQAWIVKHYVSGKTQIQIARDLGLTSSTYVCIAIARFCNKWSGINVFGSIYGKERRELAARALERYLFQGNAIEHPMSFDISLTQDLTYWRAREEHAVMLRFERLPYNKIGERLGVSPERTRQMILSYGRRLRKAMRCTKWRIIHGS